ERSQAFIAHPKVVAFSSAAGSDDLANDEQHLVDRLLREGGGYRAIAERTIFEIYFHVIVTLDLFNSTTKWCSSEYQRRAYPFELPVDVGDSLSRLGTT